MNSHDLSDLERLARVLRYHYGSTLSTVDPENREEVNVVELLEDIVSHVKMDMRSKDVPRRRHVRKAYLPQTTVESVQTQPKHRRDSNSEA